MIRNIQVASLSALLVVSLTQLVSAESYICAYVGYLENKIVQVNFDRIDAQNFQESNLFKSKYKIIFEDGHNVVFAHSPIGTTIFSFIISKKTGEMKRDTTSLNEEGSTSERQGKCTVRK